MWPAGSLPGRYLAGFTLGIFGTFYYAGHTIHADSVPSDADSQSSHGHILGKGHRYHNDSALHHNATPEQWNAPSYRDKISENSETARILGNSGIARIDVVALAKFVGLCLSYHCTNTYVYSAIPPHVE